MNHNNPGGGGACSPLQMRDQQWGQGQAHPRVHLPTRPGRSQRTRGDTHWPPGGSRHLNSGPSEVSAHGCSDAGAAPMMWGYRVTHPRASNQASVKYLLELRLRQDAAPPYSLSCKTGPRVPPPRGPQIWAPVPWGPPPMQFQERPPPTWIWGPPGIAWGGGLQISGPFPLPWGILSPKGTPWSNPKGDQGSQMC